MKKLNLKMWWSSFVVLLCLILLSACAETGAVLGQTANEAVDWREEIIYFAVTDRFSNGDTRNDNGAARPGAADELALNNPLGWHGGDFAGLQAKIEEGYFERMGFSAIWITPVYLQVPAISAEGGSGPNIGNRFAGYHGYWAEDFFQVDPHFGTLAEMKSLVDTAHANGLKIIQDMVLNHVGYGADLVAEQPDWLPQRPDCYSAGLTGDDLQINCALAGLPDFDQSVPEVRAYLDDAVTFWRDEVGIDGVRMDTVKHVPDDYWRSFFAAGGAGDPSQIWTVGEIFSGDVSLLASYMDDLNVPAVFDFALYFGIKDNLSSAGGRLDGVAAILEQDSVYDDASRLVTFVDNHDVRRFMSEAVERGVPENEARERLDTALSLIYTVRGTPVVYQGSETAMQGLGDPYDYELGRGNREDMNFEALATSALDERLGALAQARRSYPALTRGEQQLLWRPNGGAEIMAYRRILDGEASVVAVLNNSDGEIDLGTLSGGGIPTLDTFGEGATLSEVTGQTNSLSLDAQGRLVGTVPARTLLSVASEAGSSPDPETPDPETPDPETPGDADLANVTDLSALGGDRGVRLAWTPVTDAAVTGYRAYYRAVGASDFTQNSFAPLPSDSESTIIYGLENGAEYEFKLVSVDEGGAQSSGPELVSATPNEDATSTVTFTVDARSQAEADIELRRFDTGEQLEYDLNPVADQPGFWSAAIDLPFLKEISFKFGNDAPSASNGGYEGEGQGDRSLVLDDPEESYEGVYDFIEIAPPN